MNQFLEINRTDTYSVKYEEAKKLFGSSDVIPMWVADMDLASPEEVTKAIQKRALHPIYGYTIYPQEYFKSIVLWMKKRYNLSIQESWIVPASGVVTSINFAIQAYTNLDDGIIVQTPIYPPFISSVKNHKRKLLGNRLLYTNGKYHIDFEDFEKKAKEAKLFLLSSPHNPTGRAWSKEELISLMEICKKYGVLVVSDEIHADLVYSGSNISFASLGYDGCIVLNAPSKTFNIAGLKTSYAIIPNRKLRFAYEAVQRNSGIESGNPFGIEALMAAYNQGDLWLEELKSHLSRNIDLIKDSLTINQIPIKPIETEATFLMWLDCKKLYNAHKQITDFFYKEAKLGLSDGKLFGNGGERFMRLNFGTSSMIISKALKQLSEAYARTR
ncbi:MAG: PatB family C-S lyase [Sulfurovaceae bacterium]|nr:PatB family C-S lyase [Sulfurovaceae bacterium]